MGTVNGLVPGILSGAESIAQALESFSLIACALHQVCDRSLNLVLRDLGGRYPPGSAFASILPGLLLWFWPVSCPSNARAVVVGSCFLSALWQAPHQTPCRLRPASVHETAHADVHYHAQRQKHKQDGRPAITH